MREFKLGGGNANPETFPYEEIARVAAEAIREVGGDFASYPGELGHEGLRRLMAQRESTREGIEVSPDQIVLTNGSMQAVTLMAEALMEKPGDIILLDELCYMGTIDMYKKVGAELVGIPVDEDGMRVDLLEEQLEALHQKGTPPSFIYTITTYQNPTGAVMSLARRHQLIDVAQRYNCIVVEDNCYGDVHFEGEKQPALYALDSSPNHIYLGSLSKILGPGLRLGYFFARPPMLQRLLERRGDGGNSLLAASIIAAYFKDEMWNHIERANRALKEKRDALMASLQEHLGDICSWSHPVGGLFLWVNLPHNIDMTKLAELANATGVRYVPGCEFHVDGTEIPNLRLAFGHPPIADIREAIPLLAGCIRAASSHSTAATSEAAG